MTNAKFDALFGGKPRKLRGPAGPRRDMDFAASIQGPSPRRSCCVWKRARLAAKNRAEEPVSCRAASRSIAVAKRQGAEGRQVRADLEFSAGPPANAGRRGRGGRLADLLSWRPMRRGRVKRQRTNMRGSYLGPSIPGD